MGTCIFDKLATSQAAPEDQAMKRNNEASELVDAMREAAEIAEGTAQPAAVHQFQCRSIFPDASCLMEGNLR